MKRGKAPKKATSIRKISVQRATLVVVLLAGAAGLLALFSGASDLVPLGRETADEDGRSVSFLVLNPPGEGTRLAQCDQGTMKATVASVAVIRDTPDDSGTPLGASELGQLVCALEQGASGWWRVSLPPDGELQGWAKSEAFRTVRVSLADDTTRVSESGVQSTTALSAQVTAVEADLKGVQSQLREGQEQAKATQELFLAQLREFQIQAKAAQDQVLAQLNEAQGQAKATQDKLQTTQIQVTAAQREVQTANRRLRSLESARTMLTVIAVVLPILVGAAALGGLALIWRRLPGSSSPAP